MAVEILFVRCFEIASLIGFVLMTVYIGLFLWLIKLGLVVLGFIAKPAIAIFIFYVTRCLGVILWSLGQAVVGLESYAETLWME